MIEFANPGAARPKMRVRLTPDHYQVGQTIHAVLEPESDFEGKVEWWVTPIDDEESLIRSGSLAIQAPPDAPEHRPYYDRYGISVDGLDAGSFRFNVDWGGEDGPYGSDKEWDKRYDDHIFFVDASPTATIALVKQPVSGITADPLATYDDFIRYLGKKNGPKPLVSLDEADYGRPRALDDNFYYKLKRRAAKYVREEVTCSGLMDLAAPYLDKRLEDEPNKLPGLAPALTGDVVPSAVPCVELIWNYWLEEGMLVQTLNLILARFQNRVVPGFQRLARFDISPLVSLQGLLYDFVDDEQHRLTVRRRAAEYEYEYGLRLIGKAIPPSRAFVERRAGFLEGFHQVLYLAHIFFKEEDDMTVNADAFPLYRALRETHLALSQGSHNQYGQMARSARAEFLVMQYLLARPEMREFLGGRPMTPYQEPWQDRVDSMKALQPEWPETSIMHYFDLATLGERLVLTIRLGNWNGSDISAPQAMAWARAFREPIQKYVAAYRAVTGVDLSRTPDATMPASLLQRRLDEQLGRG